MLKINVVCLKCGFIWRAKKLVDIRCPRCGLLGKVPDDAPDVEVKIMCRPFVSRPFQG